MLILTHIKKTGSATLVFVIMSSSKFSRSSDKVRSTKRADRRSSNSDSDTRSSDDSDHEISSLPAARNKHVQGHDREALLKEVQRFIRRQEASKLDWKARREWMKENEGWAYEVLSRSVRHELNKYYFDQKENPSKAELNQLWYDLMKIDSSVQRSKIRRWFQNKRQYMKKQFAAKVKSAAKSRRKSSSESESSCSE